MEAGLELLGAMPLSLVAPRPELRPVGLRADLTKRFTAGGNSCWSFPIFGIRSRDEYRADPIMMQPFEKTLPFKTDGAYHGFAEVSGMLHIERDHLELEFEIKDSLFGALKSGPKQLEIAYSDLSKLTYVRTIFKSRLEIKVKSLRVLSRFPAAQDGLISLKIKRKLKEETEDIATYVNLRIAEIGLEKLQG